MSPVRKKRFYMVLLLVVGVSIATFLIVQAFSQNMMFFFSTSEVKQGKAPADRDFRLGGLVVEGSVKRDSQSLMVRFDLTDTLTTVPVEYTGILPDLFREGQGIISKGSLNAQGVFIAEEVLAKHDENYMPPEVADSLKKATEQNLIKPTPTTSNEINLEVKQ
ncbi:cytochrome c maturation protein CcmE [Thiomicrorhabdus lithotrophica]|uniref:Cytochrome c-type biogenesis protein CcmE n=1 Tax=Thiomicrorhabdus lithotrophica TaxID=2949997 RepID=A0ABY8C9K0_9GAMM|nr:cytochrome c maturation protein CcmE [Thiomicrorhabdus lithotrophica]WEJ62217.1 cytochrome c maturation protein CcmE [Thiomicrorhabdus lithotrophica]